MAGSYANQKTQIGLKSMVSESESHHIGFLTPAQLEAEMASEQDYYGYYYSLYRCLPSDNNELNKRRDQIKERFPQLSINLPFNEFYVLEGVAAYEILSTFYYSLHVDELHDITTEERKYYLKRFEQVKTAHERSQNLPYPINLTEGQLGTDREMELYYSQMLLNRQLVIRKS